MKEKLLRNRTIIYYCKKCDNYVSMEKVEITQDAELVHKKCGGTVCRAEGESEGEAKRRLVSGVL